MSKQEKYYSVEDILAIKNKKGKDYFLVKWEGFNHTENTWEPHENLRNVEWMIEEFLNNKAALDHEINKANKRLSLNNEAISKKQGTKTIK